MASGLGEVKDRFEFSEKRKWQRYLIQLPAQIKEKNSINHMVKGLTRDICAGGAYLICQNPFETGSCVEVAVDIPLERISSLNCRRSRFNVCGRVVRTDKHGMAVKFASRYHLSEVPAA